MISKYSCTLYSTKLTHVVLVDVGSTLLNNPHLLQESADFWNGTISLDVAIVAWNLSNDIGSSAAGKSTSSSRIDHCLDWSSPVCGDDVEGTRNGAVRGTDLREGVAR